MSKYLRNYKDLDIAKSDETIVSPNVMSIENSKILHLDTHVKGEELLIIGDSLENARLVKKYIADNNTNPELIALARSLRWIDSEAERMSVLDAMAVTTVNDESGNSLLNGSKLKSFDEFEWFTSVTVPPMGAPSLPDSCTSIKLPDSIISIIGGAFSGCRGLVSVTISNSVDSIGGSAFAECDSLKSVDIGNSVTNIGEGAFKNCSSLTSVEIPNSVMDIGGYSFSYCSELKSVTIGNSVTSIGYAAFSGCGSLTSIIFTGTSAQWRAITRGSEWHVNVPSTTVYCEGDGRTVGLDETV